MQDRKLMGFLKSFELIRPKQQLAQDQLLDWLAHAYARAETVNASAAGTALAAPNGNAPASSAGTAKEAPSAQRLRRMLTRFACDSRKIGSRGVELGDASHLEFERMEIYRIAPPTHDAGPYLEGASGAGMLKRTQFFSKAALGAMEGFYPAKALAPAHLIHVTCTGYSSPSCAQSIVDLRGWHGQTDVTHAYHMGCYASLPAIRMAAGFVALQGRPVDIVHTELCTLHLNTLDHSPEQMVVNSLFADGFVKYTLGQTRAPGERALELLHIREYVIPGTRDLMTWNSADWGMKMTLSREVPKEIAGRLHAFLDRLLEDAGFASSEARETAKREAIFAIHPGGPKIIDSTQELLGLREDQVHHAKQVLFDYGNMSSATLPHVWHSILGDVSIPHGRTVISLAFGPGLTIFGALQRKHSA